MKPEHKVPGLRSSLRLDFFERTRLVFFLFVLSQQDLSTFTVSDAIIASKK
jgi:hypothetical protein